MTEIDELCLDLKPLVYIDIKINKEPTEVTCSKPWISFVKKPLLVLKITAEIGLALPVDIRLRVWPVNIVLDHLIPV